MYDAKIIKLLTEMKMNCLGGTAYDDPFRGDKAEALNYAIFAVNAVSGDYRWHDLRKNPVDLPVLGKKVVGYFKNPNTWTIGMVHRHENGWRVDECGLDNWELLAWKEIEPFEVTE